MAVEPSSADKPDLSEVVVDRSSEAVGPSTGSEELGSDSTVALGTGSGAQLALDRRPIGG